jgi:hypothetical protein
MYLSRQDVVGELLGNVGRNVVAKISPSHDVYRPDLSLNGKVKTSSISAQ